MARACLPPSSTPNKLIIAPIAPAIIVAATPPARLVIMGVLISGILPQKLTKKDPIIPRILLSSVLIDLGAPISSQSPSAAYISTRLPPVRRSDEYLMKFSYCTKLRGLATLDARPGNAVSANSRMSPLLSDAISVSRYDLGFLLSRGFIPSGLPRLVISDTSDSGR